MSALASIAAEGTGAPLWAYGLVVFVIWQAVTVLNFRRRMSGLSVVVMFAVVIGLWSWVAAQPAANDSQPTNNNQTQEIAQ